MCRCLFGVCSVCAAACSAALCVCNVCVAVPIRVLPARLESFFASYDTCPISYAVGGDFWDELWDEWPRNSALMA